MKSNELRQIREILIGALDDLENLPAREIPSGSWPSLYSPIDVDRNEPHNNPKVQQICNVIIAAAYQLICLVREPFLTLADAACGVSYKFVGIKAFVADVRQGFIDRRVEYCKRAQCCRDSSGRRFQRHRRDRNCC